MPGQAVFSVASASVRPAEGGVGPEFIWRRSRGGWGLCVEMVEGLRAGGRQGLRAEADRVEIEVV